MEKLPELEEFRLFDEDVVLNRALKDLYQGSDLIHQTANRLFQAVEVVGQLRWDLDRSSSLYPEDDWGEELGYQLRTIAQLIKQDVGISLQTIAPCWLRS